MAPAVDAGEMEADPNRLMSEQVQHQPQGRTSGQLPSFSQEGTSLLEFITQQRRESVMKKRHHALNTTTLLMNTLLLINSSKYHCYFISLTSLLREQPRDTRQWDEGQLVFTKFQRSS